MYRESALRNLALSERLDTVIEVVSPAALFVVATAALTIGTAVVWACIGRVPTRVYGEGLLVRQGSIGDVTSMAEGQVERVAVSVGDLVKENDPIAYVDQPELKKQHSLLLAKLVDLSEKSKQLEELDERGRDLKAAVFHQQRTAVGYSLTETKKQLTFYRDKLRSDTTLLDKGLATPAAVAETRQKVLDLQATIYGKRAEDHDIAFNALETTRMLEQRKYDLAMQVNETNREVQELQKRIDTQSVVVAKSTGRVIEVKVTEGDAVTRGRAIATLEVVGSDQADLMAEVFIPAQDGKRVKAGMTIKLAPSVVKPEENGYLLGTVESISPFPVSAQSIVRTVRNESLVTSLLKDGPVYEARVRVGADPSTPSGLRWSNGVGPSMQIASGTPVHGLVTVRTRRPIELIIPAVKRIVTDGPAQD